MNLSDFVMNNGRSVGRQHFLNLVQVSRADGKILGAELDILHREGRKFGLTPPEVDKLIEIEGKNHYNPPYELTEKFDHLYKVAEIILADNEVTEGERKLIWRFAIEAGFSDKTIPKLIDLLIDGIRKGEDEETLLNVFRSKYLFKD